MGVWGQSPQATGDPVGAEGSHWVRRITKGLRPLVILRFWGPFGPYFFTGPFGPGCSALRAEGSCVRGALFGPLVRRASFASQSSRDTGGSFAPPGPPSFFLLCCASLRAFGPQARARVLGPSGPRVLYERAKGPLVERVARACCKSPSGSCNKHALPVSRSRAVCNKHTLSALRAESVCLLQTARSLGVRAFAPRTCAHEACLVQKGSGAPRLHQVRLVRAEGQPFGLWSHQLFGGGQLSGPAAPPPHPQPTAAAA